MGDDDPFAGAEDSERTVIRPTPGRRRPPSTGARAAPNKGQVAPDAEAALSITKSGVNELAAAAAPIINLAAKFKNSVIKTS